jgi:uncharacterized protein
MSHLLHNLVLYGRLLHTLGLDINPGRMVDCVQALDHIDLQNKADFYHTLRTLLVQKKEELPLFDHAFNLFWRAPDQKERLIHERIPVKGDTATPIVRAPGAEPPDPESIPPGDHDQPILEATRTYSQREQLRYKPFDQLSAAELRAVKLLMRSLAWQLGQRRTRRAQAARHGTQVDLRRAFRHSVRHGGELIVWPRRRPKRKPRPLIILADISGSMAPYSRLLLQFVYSLSTGLDQHVEAFVFGTRLTRITRPLRNKDVDVALTAVAQQIPDWAGGTRIGAAIKQFNFEWGRHILGRGAVVMLISDGWDRGEPELLHREIGRLHRSCHRLIWLNPLLGMVRYEPLTRGMQAALPHIDDFLPVHNLASLETLADHLALLSQRKRPLHAPPINPSGAAFSKNRT